MTPRPPLPPQRPLTFLQHCLESVSRENSACIHALLRSRIENHAEIARYSEREERKHAVRSSAWAVAHAAMLAQALEQLESSPTLRQQLANMKRNLSGEGPCYTGVTRMEDPMDDTAYTKHFTATTRSRGDDGFNIVVVGPCTVAHFVARNVYERKALLDAMESAYTGGREDALCDARRALGVDP